MEGKDSRKKRPVPVRERAFTDTHEEPDMADSDLKYTEAEWLVPATDTKGHSCKEYVRLPPALLREMEIWLSRKVFPYKTLSDMIRHAVYRHAFFMHKIEPHFKRHMISALQALTMQMSDMHIQLDMRDSLETLKTQFRRYSDLREYGAAIDTYNEASSILQSIPNSSPYKKQALSEWKELKRGIIERVGLLKPQSSFGVPTRVSALPKPDPED